MMKTFFALLDWLFKPGYKHPEGEDAMSDSVLERLGTLVLLLLFCGFFWLGFKSIGWFAEFIQFIANRYKQTAADPFVAGFLAMFVVAMGWAFYWMRERFRIVYALVEVGMAVGVVVQACYQFGSDTTNFAFLFSLMGALYVVVRGFDNASKAQEERRRKQQDKRM